MDGRVYIEAYSSGYIMNVCLLRQSPNRGIFGIACGEKGVVFIRLLRLTSLVGSVCLSVNTALEQVHGYSIQRILPTRALGNKNYVLDSFDLR